MQCNQHLKPVGQRIRRAQGILEQQEAGILASTENQERKLHITFYQFAWADLMAANE